MTDGLPPEMSKTVLINSIGAIEISFGRVAESAVTAVYGRVYQDGLTLSDRLWRLDGGIRREIEDKVVQAVAQGKSARELAKELRSYLTEAGQENARYNSMRLARTEISHAHREGHIQSCLDRNGQMKDYLTAIGWRLSDAHTVPDICDEWASADCGLGPGNYLPDDVPVDHPNGFCFTVGILASEPDMQFVITEPQPPAAEVAA
jgi:hypothetical protein